MENKVTSIKILGGGCKNCHTLFDNAQAAAKSAGIEAQVELITDMKKIMEYGIMSTPALVINEKVVSMGRVLKEADVAKLLK